MTTCRSAPPRPTRDAAARREREAARQPELPTKAEALAHIQSLCRAYYPQFAATCPGGRMPKIAVRDMTTRWGSCSAKGNVNFNYQLAFLPDELLDYVVIHELAHRHHMDHSRAFWAEVEKYCPDYLERRKKLKEYSL